MHVDGYGLFGVEKEFKQQKGQALVKWKGWPDKCNSWVAIKDVFVVMSSFYVTMTSQASRNELLDNQTQQFKNRLHHPLILREPGWRVGLSRLSIPAAHPVSPSIGDAGKYLLE